MVSLFAPGPIKTCCAVGKRPLADASSDHSDASSAKPETAARMERGRRSIGRARCRVAALPSVTLARSRQLVLFETRDQRAARHAEQLRRLRLVAGALLEGAQDQV